MMGFPLIFSETNFMEVPKIHEIHKIMALEERAPYGMVKLVCPLGPFLLAQLQMYNITLLLEEQLQFAITLEQSSTDQVQE